MPETGALRMQAERLHESASTARRSRDRESPSPQSRDTASRERDRSGRRVAKPSASVPADPAFRTTSTGCPVSNGSRLRVLHSRSIQVYADIGMTSSAHTAPATIGRVLHWDAGCDLLVWLLTRRSGRAFREQLLGPAHFAAGQSVLDIGCGTGTLAIVARGQFGADGKVFDIDASGAMIARASSKAAEARVDVRFETAVVARLPFPQAHFDVVLSTLMFHHRPRKLPAICTRDPPRPQTTGPRACCRLRPPDSPSQAFSSTFTVMETLTQKKSSRSWSKRACAVSRADPSGSAASSSCGRWLSSERTQTSRAHLDRHPRSGRADRGARRCNRVTRSASNWFCLPWPPL
jgi:SAM-dependent methyltransferase